jgi:mRNA interferase RelE/StbE
VADYSIVFARSARKELQGLDPPIALRLLKRIETLAKDPRPAGVVKLEGATDLWRIRVGEWRVVYRIDNRVRLVDITSIGHRREAIR